AQAVVSEPGHDAAEGLRLLVEHRPAGVVLEARENLSPPGHELALEQDVADHPPLARNRVEGEEADARQLVALAVAVEAAEELVTAADREHGRAAGRGLADRGALVGQVAGDQGLLAILAAADVQEV